MVKILVLCRCNAARSQFLEAILSADKRIEAVSAGTAPLEALHPEAQAILTAKGAGHQNTTKHWRNLPNANGFDIAILLGDDLKVLPEGLNIPVVGHWPAADPTRQAKELWPSAFQASYIALHDRAEDFLSFPLECMDRDALQAVFTVIEVGHDHEPVTR